MPLYEYACQACEHKFETLVRGGELPECPSCHGTHLEKKQSTFAGRISGGSPLTEIPSARHLEIAGADHSLARSRKKPFEGSELWHDEVAAFLPRD